LIGTLPLSSEFNFFQVAGWIISPKTITPPLLGAAALTYGLAAEETPQLITMVNVTKRMHVLKPVSNLLPAHLILMPSTLLTVFLTEGKLFSARISPTSSFSV
jgi:hypothetical protein